MLVDRQLAENLPKIKGIAPEIQQVLMNMFINASHACDEHGELTITTDTLNEKGKAWVQVQIADNGHGISPEHLAKFLIPFSPPNRSGLEPGWGYPSRLELWKNIKVRSR